MTPEKWHMTKDAWQKTHDIQMKNYRWWRTPDTGHLKLDILKTKNGNLQMTIDKLKIKHFKDNDDDDEKNYDDDDDNEEWWWR